VEARHENWVHSPWKAQNCSILFSKEKDFSFLPCLLKLVLSKLYKLHKKQITH